MCCQKGVTARVVACGQTFSIYSILAAPHPSSSQGQSVMPFLHFAAAQHADQGSAVQCWYHQELTHSLHPYNFAVSPELPLKAVLQETPSLHGVPQMSQKAPLHSSWDLLPLTCSLLVVTPMLSHQKPAQSTAEESYLKQLKLLQPHLHELSGVWPEVTVLHLDVRT